MSSAGTSVESTKYVAAQAAMHHAYLLGLQLMISTNKGPEVMGDWMFRLFRRQHLEKFLSSFDKLGLSGLPDAVACARYHVMSNSIGGVPVEYMYESDNKAWVRFRYPRWMYHGPTICGVPQQVSQGFLDGWYAHNGVSLGNARLGFVCVSEDMTGEFGLCGYFKEYDHDLKDHERLQFARGELPPPYKADEQPLLPTGEWSEERLQKANRNYAMDYIRNGLCELVKVIGEEETILLGGKAARLIGLQYCAATREMVGTTDGDTDAAAEYLTRMFEGMGDTVETNACDGQVELRHSGLRITRGLDEQEALRILRVWVQIWQGALSSFQAMKAAETSIGEGEILWGLRERV